MDAPTKDLERVQALLSAAREHLLAGRLPQAEEAAQAAQAVDPNNPKAPELRAEISRALGHPELAEQHASLAKHLREQAWKRSVEAEARGHHDMLGQASRHELP
jgi:Tfp pilus assembly protein PilF